MLPFESFGTKEDATEGESKLKFEACHLKPLYFDFGFILASLMKVPTENLLSVG